MSALPPRLAPDYAPWVYSLLPVAIALFIRSHRHRGRSAGGEPPPA